MEEGLLFGVGSVMLLAAALNRGRRMSARSFTGTLNQGNIKAGGDVSIGAPVTTQATPPPTPMPLWEGALTIGGSVASLLGLVLVLWPDLLK